jgi:hypothetical protein
MVDDSEPQEDFMHREMEHARESMAEELWGGGDGKFIGSEGRSTKID